MASPSNGTVYRALNASIDEAVRAGRIDRKAQGALIAVARKVARLMDDPDWPIICKDVDGKGKLDNVSPSFLLKYCEALGICPELPRADAKRNRGELSKLRDGIKSMKLVG